jgi:hypothetical protein
LEPFYSSSFVTKQQQNWDRTAPFYLALQPNTTLGNLTGGYSLRESL